MTHEYELHHRETGPLGENDEYWTLVVPDHGVPYVRHQRSWGNPYRGEVKQDPPRDTPVVDFLEGQSFGPVYDALLKRLRELDLGPGA
ncbi:hypothetical protein AUC70_05855 [Methyloceanibacter stevinii]|uniref:Uncharacterized protein n=2 Tax=Methyloceanibacter stevinii TaxID=1774970 RepID=A0A1E3VPJ4_9HYPH|nr:hypothetical protein AUC70_05855 [Methyloceanibacter stevinii]